MTDLTPTKRNKRKNNICPRVDLDGIPFSRAPQISRQDIRYNSNPAGLPFLKAMFNVPVHQMKYTNLYVMMPNMSDRCIVHTARGSLPRLVCLEDASPGYTLDNNIYL